ncbi:protease inhibitor I42 family protein [Mesorhizobium sp. LSJC264A00]|uniref:protease inhibitor I42 family protein n=1 Tax=unclassified Mesorhizobium TaxID=325217 RepID=UPI0003CED923|nr:protease inhibitor I42 family protein [Mesorhizobium sp. LSJC264A00]ESX24444.1 hypothetical protein X767_12265 [Mesorhizobium sp. LSJC264A00]
MKAFKVDTLDNAKQELRVKGGEKVAIELEGAGTTGYAWEVAKQAPELEVIGHSVEPNLESFGAAGTDRFVVRADSLGSHDIELTLKAPWESAPVKRLTVKIKSE